MVGGREVFDERRFGLAVDERLRLSRRPKLRLADERVEDQLQALKAKPLLELRGPLRRRDLRERRRGRVSELS